MEWLIARGKGRNWWGGLKGTAREWLKSHTVLVESGLSQTVKVAFQIFFQNLTLETSISEDREVREVLPKMFVVDSVKYILLDSPR